MFQRPGYTRGIRDPKTFCMTEFEKNGFRITNPMVIIYVARSPKDAATSFYYHNCLIHGLTLSLDEYLECFLADSVPFTPYWTNVLEFWKLRNEPNILWNTYEEMKQVIDLITCGEREIFGYLVV
uniref:Sulfotransferase n=1 Tax=Locusta migratoria migratoria TaxID=238695 RepID=A0A1B0Y0B5_LOCMI|nr:sulfotransferase [Locusta migratoria migratoria]